MSANDYAGLSSESLHLLPLQEARIGIVCQSQRKKKIQRRIAKDKQPAFTSWQYPPVGRGRMISPGDLKWGHSGIATGSRFLSRLSRRPSVGALPPESHREIVDFPSIPPND